MEVENPEIHVDGKPKGGLPSAAWLALGLAAGICATLLIISMKGPGSKPEAKANLEQSQYQADSAYSADDSADEEKLPSVASGGPKTAAPSNEAQTEQYAADRGPGTQPPNGNPAPPPLPGGTIGGGTTPPLTPVVVVGEQPTGPEVAHSEFVAVTSGAEFESELQRAIGAVRAAGGKVLLEFAHEPDRPEMGTEVFVSVDKGSADKLRKGLQAISAHEVASWAGQNAERTARMQRSLREERGKAAQQLQELQLKYMDDATQVIMAKERLERYERALSALGSVPDTKTTFRITIGRPR